MTEVREQRSATQYTASRDDVPLSWLLVVLLRDRRVILAFMMIGVFAAVLIGVFKRPMYTASFSFLPQTTQDQGRSGLASLAGQLGIPLGMVGGQAQPPQLYADLVKTREVLAPIALGQVTVGGQRITLREYLGIGGSDSAVALEETIRALRAKVISSGVESRTTGSVTVRARTKSPELSLQIAQQVLDGLNQFNRVTRQSQANEERRFTEGRLEAARLSLREAEDALQRFLQSNRQYGNSSQLRFEEDRLQREVTLRQQVVVGLAQQYEDARIREVRDTPVITVIERPSLPVIADPRGRVRTLVVLTFVATVLGMVIVLMREGWRRQRTLGGDDPSYEMLATEWQRFRRMLRIS